MPFQHSSGIPSPDVVSKWFRSRGWSLGNNRGRDQCPRCSTPDREEKPVIKQPLKLGEIPPHDEKASDRLPTVRPQDVPAIAEAMSTTPTREDRRSIISALMTSYDAERQHYLGDHSDKKLAASLGVAISWVKNIREDFCGPDRSEGSVKALAQLAELKADADRLEATVLQSVDDLAYLRNRIVTLSEALA